MDEQTNTDEQSKEALDASDVSAEDTSTSDEQSQSETPEDEDLIGLDEYKTDEDSDEGATSDEEQPEDVSKYKIGENEYTEDELAAALDSHNNMNKWQQLLTQKGQELAEEKKRFEELSMKIDDLGKEQDQPLSEEEQATRKWLDDHGYIRKEDVDKYLEERIGPLQEAQQQMTQQEAMKQVTDELNFVQDKYGLSDKEKEAIWNHAAKNDMAHLNMEVVYLDMNKDKLGAFAQDKIRRDAGEKRKERAAKTQSPRSAAPSKNPALTKYVSDRDKDKSLDEVIAQAMNNY